MNLRITQDATLGALVLAFGLFVVFVWAPLDSETGVAERVRGRWAIGDALALALICDLPFEDLLLPPNGDV